MSSAFFEKKSSRIWQIPKAIQKVLQELRLKRKSILVSQVPNLNYFSNLYFPYFKSATGGASDICRRPKFVIDLNVNISIYE